MNSYETKIQLLPEVNFEKIPTTELLDTLVRAPLSYGAPSVAHLFDDSVTNFARSAILQDINVIGLAGIGKSVLASQWLAKWEHVTRSMTLTHPGTEMVYLSWDDVLRTVGRKLGITDHNQRDGGYTHDQLHALTLMMQKADYLAKKEGLSVLKEFPGTGLLLHNVTTGKDRGATLLVNSVKKNDGPYTDPALSPYDTKVIWLTAAGDVRGRGQLIRRAMHDVPEHKKNLLQSEGTVFTGRKGFTSTAGATTLGIEAVAKEEYEAMMDLFDLYHLILPPRPRVGISDEDYHALCVEQALAPAILGWNYLQMHSKDAIVAQNKKKEVITRYQNLLDKRNFITRLVREGRLAELAA